MRVGATRVHLTFLMVLLCLAASIRGQGSFTVVQVNELVRHGSASPEERLLFPIAQDQHDGWTTANGLRSMFLLGAQLKKNYPAIFDQSPKQKQFRVFAATPSKCSQSAGSHILGLFPPGTGNEISVATDTEYVRPELDGVETAYPGKDSLPNKYLPFDLGFKSALNDRRFLKADPDSATCPGFRQYLDEKDVSRDAKYSKELQTVSDQLRAAGFDSKTIIKKDRFSLSDAWVISQELEWYASRNNKLPAGVTAELSATIDRLAAVELLSYLAGDLKQAVTDTLGRELSANLKGFAEGKLDKKGLVYVGEAENLLAFYAALKLTSLDCLEDAIRKGTASAPCRLLPRSAESIIFELNKREDKFFVRALVNGEPLQLCKENESSHYCKLDDFRELLADKTFYEDEDLEELCQNPLTWDGVISQPDWYTNWVTITGFTVLALLILLLLLLCFHGKLASLLAPPEKPKRSAPPAPKLNFMKYTDEDD